MVLTKEFQKIGTGTQKTYGGSAGYLELWAKYNSQDIVNNKSNITVELRLVVPYGYIGNYQATYWSIDGNLSNSGNLGSGDYRSRTLGSVTGNITHENDGKKNVSFTGNFNPTAWGYSIDVSASVTLPTIPRSSTILATSAYIGELSRIKVTQYSTQFTHSIQYSFKNLSGYILADGTITDTETKISALQIDFPIPSSWFNKIPNEPEAECTLTIKTYKDNELIGSAQTTTFFARANESSSNPELTASVVDSNQTTLALTGDSNILVKGHSTVSLTWSANARNGSSIASVTVNGVTVNSSPYVFTLNSENITVIATDTRGFAKTITPTFTLKNYMPPNFSMKVTRVSPTSNKAYLSFEGTWFKNSFGNTNNSLSINWKYKKAGTSTWINGGTLIAGTDYTISNNDNKFWSGVVSSASNIQIGGSLDYNYGWDIALFVTDTLEQIPAYDAISKGIPIINWESDFFNVNGDIRRNNVSIFNSFVDTFYPVGSIYMTVDSTKNPNTLFQGTEWEQLKDRFLLGAGDTYNNGDVGGAPTVTLNINQIPSHSHNVGGDKDAQYQAGGADISLHDAGTSGAGRIIATSTTGGGQAHNNMPPYLVVYMWKRIS